MTGGVCPRRKVRGNSGGGKIRISSSSADGVTLFHADRFAAILLQIRHRRDVNEISLAY